MDQQSTTRHTTVWRRLAPVLLVLLFLCTGILFYKVIDQAVTISYMQDGMHTLEEDNATLRRLVPHLAKGQTKTDVLVLLRKSNPDVFIAQTDSTLTAGQILFVFDRSGKLTRLEDLSMPQR